MKSKKVTRKKKVARKETRTKEPVRRMSLIQALAKWVRDADLSPIAERMRKSGPQPEKNKLPKTE